MCVYFCLCVCVLCTSPCWCVYVNILKTKNIFKNTRNLQRGARTMISYLHRPLRTLFSNSKEWQAVLVWSRDLHDTLRSCRETLDSGGRRHGQRKNLATDIPGWTGRSTQNLLTAVQVKCQTLWVAAAAVQKHFTSRRLLRRRSTKGRTARAFDGCKRYFRSPVSSAAKHMQIL